jgi:hypothetical protein
VRPLLASLLLLASCGAANYGPESDSGDQQSGHHYYLVDHWTDGQWIYCQYNTGLIITIPRFGRPGYCQQTIER